MNTPNQPKTAEQFIVDHNVYLGRRGAKPQGKHYDLQCDDLRGADLRDVDLWNTTGNGKQVKNIPDLYYDITYTAHVVQIGCQQHLLEEWESFTDEIINRMDTHALEFWTEYKDYIINTIKTNPAEV